MKSSLLTFVPALAAVSVWASITHLTIGCSADGAVTPKEAEPASQEDDEDAAPPSQADAAPAVDAAGCEDCAFFLPTCEAQSFCAVDLAKLGVAGTVTFKDISGTSENDVWVLGARGTILRFEGGAGWSKVDGPSMPVTQISSRADGNIWTAFTLPHLYARSPGSEPQWLETKLTPTFSTLDSESYAPVNGMWSAPDARWTWFSLKDDRVKSARPNSFHLRRIRSSDASYTHQEPFYCPTGPYNEERCPLFMDIHGSSKDDIWVVGEAGVAYRISAADTDWPALVGYDSRTHSTLYGVWTGEYGDAWAVGAHGTIRHYVGSEEHRFEHVPSPVTTTLRSVSGSSKTDIWAVGDGGVVLHYDGTTWSRVPLGGVTGKPDLFAVWAASPSRVWAAGHGVLLELSAGGGK